MTHSPAALAPIRSSITDVGFNFLEYATTPGASEDAVPFVSPLSLFFCLSLFANDPRFNAAQAQILTMFGADGKSIDMLNQAAQEILNRYSSAPEVRRTLRALQSSGTPYVFEIANAIWAKEFDDQFKALVESTYDASTFPLTPRTTVDEINDWVSTQTKGTIPTILKEMPQDVTTIFLNAIYFKGTWQIAFKKKSTSRKPFQLADGNSISVPMMFKRHKFKFVANGELGQVVALPYVYDEARQAPLHAMVILPPPSTDIHEFIKTLPAQLRTIDGKMKFTKIDLSLPRFQAKATNELLEFLADQGITSVRSSTSNEELTQVVQKVFVKVDEEGTVAAAVTAAIRQTRSFKSYPKMNCNRPFIFVLRNPDSGVASFIGLVSEQDQFSSA